MLRWRGRRQKPAATKTGSSAADGFLRTESPSPAYGMQSGGLSSHVPPKRTANVLKSSRLTTPF